MQATRLSAFLTGIWTALGMGAFEAWEKAHPQTTSMHNVLFLAAFLVFLFVPVGLFVFGSQSSRFRATDKLTREYWIALKDSGVRGLCWLFGAAVASAVYSLLILVL